MKRWFLREFTALLGFIVGFGGCMLVTCVIFVIINKLTNAHIPYYNAGSLLSIIYGLREAGRFRKRYDEGKIGFSLKFLKTPIQRTAFLSLCASLLLLSLQLLVFSYYESPLGVWEYSGGIHYYWWSNITQCVALIQYRCHPALSHYLVYLNIVWTLTSLIYILSWKRLNNLKTLIHQWIINE